MCPSYPSRSLVLEGKGCFVLGPARPDLESRTKISQSGVEAYVISVREFLPSFPRVANTLNAQGNPSVFTHADWRLRILSSPLNHSWLQPSDPEGLEHASTRAGLSQTPPSADLERLGLLDLGSLHRWPVDHSVWIPFLISLGAA